MLCSYTVDVEAGGIRVNVDGRFMHFSGVTPKQMIAAQKRYDEGAKVQNAFSFLNEDQREFLMTGLTPEEWNYLFEEA